MLSKANKINKKFMEIALSLAEERIGLTGTNPSVGCVIVKDNKIISYGQTGFGGVPHAESNAIENATDDVKGSTLYSTLEPCCHYGKTPPCTKKIINSKIKKVVYAVDDIDTRTSKKSKKLLLKNNISVLNKLLEKKAKNLYKSYFFNKKSQFPYITAKIASSKNYIIKSKNKYITNKFSLKLSHLLRYKNQGILISERTLSDDDPFLNCRLSGLSNFSPKRIILDKNLKIKKNSNILKTSHKYKTIIFYHYKNKKFKYLFNNNVKLIKSPLDKFNRLDLFFILKKIKELKINYLLVEGGKSLTNSLIENKLINEFYYFINKSVLKGNSKSDIYKIIKKINYSFKNRVKLDTYLEDDNVIRYF